ncbi:MAG: hypothetical protein M0C28_34150 [Candidatus Moduliflexus flocculans]|nr:hypothetical protein [Candidatus Moduliflexus flocculans]
MNETQTTPSAVSDGLKRAIQYARAGPGHHRRRPSRSTCSASSRWYPSAWAGGDVVYFGVVSLTLALLTARRGDGGVLARQTAP